MKFDVNVSKILNIVINNIYTNKDIFVRELASNSSDACEKLRYLSISDEKFANFKDIAHKIQIEINKKEKTITFKDTGIGLSKEGLVKHLGTIANSGTGEFLKTLENSQGDAKADLIGQFGVGFYSSYLVADKVEVRTKSATEEKYNIWISDGKEDFTIEELQDFKSDFNTEIKLFIKEEELDYLDRFKISNIVKTYSNHISFPIEVSFIGEKEEENIKEVVNKTTAIWLRDKNEISEEEYFEFYKSLSHNFNKPFGTIHKKIEGGFEYRSLLFIPFEKPFDVFNPDRNTKIKLYIKKVFINEANNDVIPKYLRFVYGVIDSDDLPLNISRETIQNNVKIKLVKEKITSDILKFLLDKKKNNKADYDKFWNNLGQVLKEGLCDGFENREMLLDLIQFKTLKSGDELISFEDYVSDMKEGQKEIYYLVGENLEDLKKSPYLETAKAKDLDVIILTDAIDSFWLSLVSEFKGKNIVSVSDVEFKDETKSDQKADDANSNATCDSEDGEKKMVELFEGALKGKVKKVRISCKLIQSAACMSLDPGMMHPSMEDMLIQQGQLKERALKNLEINPSNILIKKTSEFLESADEESKKKGEKLANSILGLAKVSQGEFPKDKVNFSKDIMELLAELV